MKITAVTHRDGTVFIDAPDFTLTTYDNGQFNVADLVSILIAAGIDVEYKNEQTK